MLNMLIASGGDWDYTIVAQLIFLIGALQATFVLITTELIFQSR
jgi:hypothetical protein